MAVRINGNYVSVELADGTFFGYRSEFVRDGKVINDEEFGEELREKIYGQ